MADKTISCMADLRALFLDIKYCLDHGLQVKIAIKSTKELKTLDQLGYYWAVIVPTIRDHFRQDGDKLSLHRVHTDLKMAFYYTEFVSIVDDTVRREPKSLTGISKQRMSEFIEDIIRWASIS